MAYFGLWPLFSLVNPGSLWESGSILSLNSKVQTPVGVHGILKKCAPAREEDFAELQSKQLLCCSFGNRREVDQTKNGADADRQAPHCCDVVHDDKTIRVESVDC
eukprot:scaffold23058_cov38-Attheya_sp.AAC.1